TFETPDHTKLQNFGDRRHGKHGCTENTYANQIAERTAIDCVVQHEITGRRGYSPSAHTPSGDPPRNYSSYGRQDDDVHQNVAHHPDLARTNRNPGRKILRLPDRSRETEIGEVSARNQQHEPHSCPQRTVDDGRVRTNEELRPVLNHGKNTTVRC